VMSLNRVCLPFLCLISSLPYFEYANDPSCVKKTDRRAVAFPFCPTCQQTILPCCPSDSASGGTRLFFPPSFAYIHVLYSVVFFPPMKTELCDCILPHWNRLREKNNNSHIGNEILSYFIERYIL